MIIAIFVGIMAFVLVIGAILYTTFTYAFVLAKFWQWFLIPLGIHSINIIQAIGIMFVFSIIFQANRIHETEYEGLEEKRSYARVIAILIAPWVPLLIGYLFKIWFM